MTSTPIRIGIVGYGQIARVQHLPAIAADPSFTVAAIASPPPAEPPSGVPLFPDLAAMLAGAELDAVALCTPPRVRGALARQALGAGKHVLLEKSPAATATEARALLDQAAHRGVTVFAGWHSMFAAAVEPLREVLAARGAAGMRIVWKEDVAKWHPGATWFWSPGGMGVFDPAINAFSILAAVAPEPVFLTAARFELEPGGQTPVRATLRLATPSHADGFSAELDFRFPGPGEQWTIDWTLGDGGRALLAQGGAVLEIDGVRVVEARDEEYPRLYRRFAALIEAGRSEVETRPLELAAEAFMIAETRRSE